MLSFFGKTFAIATQVVLYVQQNIKEESAALFLSLKYIKLIRKLVKDFYI